MGPGNLFSPLPAIAAQTSVLPSYRNKVAHVYLTMVCHYILGYPTTVAIFTIPEYNDTITLLLQRYRDSGEAFKATPFMMSLMCHKSDYKT